MFLWGGFLYLRDHTFCNWQKLYPRQKFPKLHPSHKRIRGVNGIANFFEETRHICNSNSFKLWQIWVS